MEQQRLGYDDYTEEISGDNCTESAAVLAQLRLNQALNRISPPSSRFADTWQVGPSVSQKEAVRYLLTVPQYLCFHYDILSSGSLLPLLNATPCINSAPFY